MELEMLENGRVFLPVSFRRSLGINIGDTLEVYIKNGEIVLSPMRKPEPQASDNDFSSPPYKGEELYR